MRLWRRNARAALLLRRRGKPHQRHFRHRQRQSGIANNVTYDADNRPSASSVQLLQGSASFTYNFSYGYDLAGDLINNTVGSVLECYGQTVPWANLTCPTQNYTYDRLKRLTKVSDTNYSRGFSYDVYGNMSVSSYSAAPSVSGLMPRTSQSPYNAANNRLLEANYGDARGNITAIGAVNSIQYDGESRQIYTSDSGTGQAISYLYDGMGQRMERGIAGGATTFYVHDAFGNLAAEYNSAGVTPDFATCYVSYDELGSVRVVMDQNATIIARHDYLPFGEEIPGGQAGRTASFGFGNGGTITQKFTGQGRDGGTATLDYFNARYFSVVTGSFTQPDPMNAGGDILNPQSWNAYAYVLGNPLGLVDPSGMYAEANPGTPEDIYQTILRLYQNSYAFLNAPPSCSNCGGNNGKKNPPPAKTGTFSQIASTMRCAADKANSVSLAALLPSTTPDFIKNIASNDISTISDLVTGPGLRRDAAMESAQQGAGLNTAVYSVGNIATRTGFKLAQNGAGTYYAVGEVATQTVKSAAAGKLAAAVLGTVSEGKLVYDVATYAGSAVACAAGW